jgi:hypothetical protein
METKKKSNWLKPLFIIGGLIGMFLLGLVVGVFYSNKIIDWYASKTKEVKTESKKTEAAVVFTDFKATYTNSDSIGDLKFKNKTIELTGIVKEITAKDSLGSLVLADSADESFEVVCTFLNENVPALKSLKPNQKITVKGYCTGVDKPAPKQEPDEEESMFDDLKKIDLIRCIIK